MEKVMPFLKDDTGATAIEYALIATLLSIAAIFALLVVSNQIEAIFKLIEVEMLENSG